MKLGNIATIRSGLVLSRKAAGAPPGVQYRLLNLRSMNPNGYIDMEQTDVFYAAERLAPEYLSQIGDIVVRLSAPYTAVLIDSQTAGLVISSNFVIIRVDRRSILPEYLFWLVNTAQTKKAIVGSSGGNMLGAVKARFFSELEIAPLSIVDQHRIAEINRLAIHEVRQLRRLADEKERYYTMLLQNAYQKKEVLTYDDQN